MKSYQVFGSTSPEAAVSLTFCSFLLHVCVFLFTAVLPGHQTKCRHIVFDPIKVSSADMEKNICSSKSRNKGTAADQTNFCDFSLEKVTKYTFTPYYSCNLLHSVLFSTFNCTALLHIRQCIN